MKCIPFLTLASVIFSCQDSGEHLVCFTGDVLLDRGINKTARAKGPAHFSLPISELLASYKYRFVNLECPVTSLDNPLPKQIVFRGEPGLLDILKDSKVTHASLANNHANDQRSQGLRDTYNALSSIGVQAVGASVHENTSCQPVEITDKGKTIAIFPLLDLRISKEEMSNLCAGGAKNLASKIWEYKNNHPNSFAVCYIHWGIEYNPSPSPGQQETAKALIDAGADVIIGHHPHVIQKIDYYKHKPIFYSLGNFVFDQMSPETGSGIVVGLDINGSDLQTTITPYVIDDGRPLQVSEAESGRIIKKLINASRNIDVKKDNNSWVIVEKNYQITTEAVVNDKKQFAPRKISDSFFHGVASIQALNHLSGYRLSIASEDNQHLDDLHVPYPVYRFETGDINHDGKTDILLGVIKSTHFDRKETRRLFALRIDSGQIRPLWLGSKVCKNLVDFKAVGGDAETSILTIEQAKDGSFSNGLYQWEDFGLSLIRYNKENLNYTQAINNLEHEKP